jgi:Leucine-rich repeat (LRR) protein
MSFGGCADGNPVLEGDSEAIVALKRAGVIVDREPTPGMPDNTGHSVDATKVTINPGIAENLGKVKTIVTLKLTGNAVTDETLTAIANAKYLQTLDLTGCAVTNAGLKHLGSLPKLNSLTLTDTQVTAAGLADMPQVAMLFLSHLPIGDEDLENLKHLKKLGILQLDGTKVTASGVAKLKQNRPNLIVVGVKLN